jgi:hypothetical protein
MMSSPSAPPTDPSATEGAPDDRGEPRAIDLTHGGPPSELLDQMARADEVNTRLRRTGREIAFALSADGGSLQIELRDESGRVLRILSLSEAIDLAEGGVLPD